MLLGARVGAWSGSSLPYDREVAWVGGNNNQAAFVNTGVYQSQHSVYEVDVYLLNSGQLIAGNASNSGTIFGFRISNHGVGFLDERGNCRVSISQIPEIKRYLITVKDTGTTISEVGGGNEYAISLTAPNLTANRPIYLCADPEGAYYVKSSCRYYGFKYWDELGNLIRDMIPVVKSDVAYMYDKISGTLFGSGGSAALVWGEL